MVTWSTVTWSTFAVGGRAPYLGHNQIASSGRRRSVKHTSQSHPSAGWPPRLSVAWARATTSRLPPRAVLLWFPFALLCSALLCSALLNSGFSALFSFLQCPAQRSRARAQQQSRPEESRAERRRARAEESRRAEQKSSGEQSRAEQSRAEQRSAAQSRAEQSRAEQSRAE
jgi:flagellar biosynthesis GTPase FlhF